VVLLRDRPHRLSPNVLRPLRFFGDEPQVRDQGLELHRWLEDRDRLQFEPQRKDLVPEFSGGGEDRVRVLVDAGDDLEAPDDRGGEGDVLIDRLMPDVEEEGVARPDPVDLVDVLLRDAPDLLSYHDICVLPGGGGEPAGHGVAI